VWITAKVGSWNHGCLNGHKYNMNGHANMTSLLIVGHEDMETHKYKHI